MNDWILNKEDRAKKDQNKGDSVLYRDFLKAFKESTDIETSVHRKVFQKTELYCQRYKLEDRQQEIFQWTLHVLSQDRFKEGSSLDSYISKVVGEKAITVRKATQMGELVEVLGHSGKLAAQGIYRKMGTDRSVRRLLITRPEIQTKIIEYIAYCQPMHRVDQGSTHAILEAVIKKIHEELRTVSESNVRNLFFSFKDNLLLSYRAGTAKIFVGDFGRSADEESDLVSKINRLSDFDDQQRYDELYEKLADDEISESEHKELLQLTDKREEMDAKRLEYLSRLAKLRGVSLDEIIEEFRSASGLFHTLQSSTNELRAT